jgi:hypothetical protein
MTDFSWHGVGEGDGEGDGMAMAHSDLQCTFGGWFGCLGSACDDVHYCDDTTTARMASNIITKFIILLSRAERNIDRYLG